MPSPFLLVRRLVRPALVTVSIVPFTSAPGLAATFLVPTQVPTIQEAINLTQPGDTVLVEAGTYTGHGNFDLDFMGKDIVVRSQSGPLMTVIDCEGGSLPPALRRGFFFQNGETEAAVVEGFTLDRGEHWLQGGGLRIVDASPTILNCVIRSSRSTGVVCIGSTSRFQGCTFIDNHGGPGAAISSEGSSLTVEDCRFENNWHYSEGGGAGGAIYTDQSMTVTRCVFVGNAVSDDFPSMCGSRGGAFYGHGVFTDCEFVDNFACGGGAVFGGGTFVRCTFVDNYGKAGAAIGASGALTLQSCTIADNQSSSVSPSCAIYCEGVTPKTLSHTIVAFTSSGAAINVAPGAAVPTLTCSDVFGNQQGDWTGVIAPQFGTNGNFSADPLFCNRPLHDVTIDHASPCRDAPACGLVGALGVGCAAGLSSVESAAVEPIRWGMLKSRFP